MCSLCLALIPFSTDAAVERTLAPQPVTVSQGSADEDENFIICEHADQFDQDEKTGVTVLTGNVRLKMSNGFLNADKVTLYRDVDTGESIKTVAEGRVEMQEAGALATGDHAVLDHIEDIVNLHDNVVVIQEEDRLEAKSFAYNRRTGKRVGKGGVRFRVRINQKKEDEQESNNAK
jgi:lipopolysaccharide transport protein LptA